MAYWGQKSHSLMHKAQESVVCEIMECLMRQKSVVKLPTVRARWWACKHGVGAVGPIAAVHTVSFDWFLSGLAWIANLFLLKVYILPEIIMEYQI